MSDLIIGTAVLDRARPPEKSERLHVLCVYRDGQHRHEDIPVYPKGGTKGQQPQWEYEIQGDTIHVTPSLRISTTKPPNDEPVELFHNDGAWSVKFQEFKPGEYVQAYDLFRALNPK